MLENTLESPLDCKEIRPKEISPECSLEGLMLKLKLQYYCHLIWRTDSFEKTLMLRKIEGGKEGDDRGWDGWMTSLTQWTWIWASSGSWWWQGGLACCSPWGRKESDMTERLNWTELNWSNYNIPTLLVISFSHWIAFISLLKLNWSHLVDVFLYSILFHWSICLYWCQHHTSQFL